MFRVYPYTLLYAVVVLTQMFIFDKMMLSTTLLPLVYITFIALLPMNTSQLYMLFFGVLMGVSADFSMGMMGVNTIATLFVSYIRVNIIHATIGEDLVSKVVSPFVDKIGVRRFMLYVSALVLCHSALFYTLEYLSFEALNILVSRILYSSIVTIFFVWLLSIQFSYIITNRR